MSRKWAAEKCCQRGPDSLTRTIIPACAQESLEPRMAWKQKCRTKVAACSGKSGNASNLPRYLTRKQVFEYHECHKIRSAPSTSTAQPASRSQASIQEEFPKGTAYEEKRKWIIEYCVSKVITGSQTLFIVDLFKYCIAQFSGGEGQSESQVLGKMNFQY